MNNQYAYFSQPYTCDMCTSKCISICLILANLLSFALFIPLLTLKNLKNLPKYYLITTILLFLLVTSLLIFSIIIRCWQKRGSIKTTTKEQARRIAIAGYYLSINFIIFSSLNFIAIGIEFYKLNYLCIYGKYEGKIINGKKIICDDKNIYQYYSIVTDEEFATFIICVVCFYFPMIYTIALWESSIKRITFGIDSRIFPPLPFRMLQPIVDGVPDPYSEYYKEIKQQIVNIQGNEQINQRENLPRYNMIQNQQTAQYQQHNVAIAQLGERDNVNDTVNNRVNNPVINNIGNTSGRNIKNNLNYYDKY